MRKVLLIVMGILLSVSCVPKEKSQYDWNELRNVFIKTKYFSAPPSNEMIFMPDGVFYEISRTTRGACSYTKQQWIIDDKNGLVELIFNHEERVNRLVYKSFDIYKEGKAVSILLCSNKVYKERNENSNDDYFQLDSGLLGDIPENEPNR